MALFTSSYLFLVKFLKIKFLIDLHLLRSSESKNNVFSCFSLSLSLFFSRSLSVCMCVHEFVISITQKQRTASKIKFIILNRRHTDVLLNSFYKDRTVSLCTWTQKEYVHNGGFCCCCFLYILICLDYIKCSEKNMHFSYSQKYILYKMWFECYL